MQIFLRRRQGKRIDRKAAFLDSHGKIGSAEKPGDVFIAAAEIKEVGEGPVFLGVSQQKIHEKALAAAGRAQDQRVGVVPAVEIQKVGRVVVRFEHGQIFRSAQVRVARLSGVKREEER